MLRKIRSYASAVLAKECCRPGQSVTPQRGGVLLGRKSRGDQSCATFARGGDDRLRGQLAQYREELVRGARFDTVRQQCLAGKVLQVERDDNVRLRLDRRGKHMPVIWVRKL